MPRWTHKCRDSLFAMREEGMTWTAIADKLGRNIDSVTSFYRDEKRRRDKISRAKPKRSIARRPVMYGPPAPSPDWLYTRAVARLMQRVANDTGMDPAEVRARLVGREPAPKAPGSEPFHKTSSIERLCSVVGNRAAA